MTFDRDCPLSERIDALSDAEVSEVLELLKLPDDELAELLAASRPAKKRGRRTGPAKVLMFKQKLK